MEVEIPGRKYTLQDAIPLTKCITNTVRGSLGSTWDGVTFEKNQNRGCITTTLIASASEIYGSSKEIKSCQNKKKTGSNTFKKMWGLKKKSEKGGQLLISEQESISMLLPRQTKQEELLNLFFLAKSSVNNTKTPPYALDRYTICQQFGCPEENKWVIVLETTIPQSAQ